MNHEESIVLLASASAILPKVLGLTYRKYAFMTGDETGMIKETLATLKHPGP